MFLYIIFVRSRSIEIVLIFYFFGVKFFKSFEIDFFNFIFFIITSRFSFTIQCHFVPSIDMCQ